MGITDVQLSMTSLEEVFLNIAKSAELEEAKGGAPVDVVLPDGTTIKVFTWLVDAYAYTMLLAIIMCDVCKHVYHRMSDLSACCGLGFQSPEPPCLP